MIIYLYIQLLQKNFVMHLYFKSVPKKVRVRIPKLKGNLRINRMVAIRPTMRYKYFPVYPNSLIKALPR